MNNIPKLPQKKRRIVSEGEGIYAQHSSQSYYDADEIEAWHREVFEDAQEVEFGRHLLHGSVMGLKTQNTYPVKGLFIPAKVVPDTAESLLKEFVTNWNQNSNDYIPNPRTIYERAKAFLEKKK